MYYKYTLLKDLPDAKAGTNQTLNEPPEEVGCELDEKVYLQHDDKRIELNRTLLQNPEWFKKEIDDRYIGEIKCPICGETRGRMYITKKVVYNRKWENRAHEVTVWYEFICGHGTQNIGIADFWCYYDK